MKTIKNSLIDKANQLGFESYFGLMTAVNEKCYHLWLADFQKWFRDNYSIHTEVWFDNTQDDGFPYLLAIYNRNIDCFDENNEIFVSYYDTYEEALETGLLKALKLIK